MSYDVTIGDDWFNYTYNLSSLFYDHMPAEFSRGGLSELHGLTGRQAGLVIDNALGRISRGFSTVAALSERYDAPNGWGTAFGAIMFLTQIRAACAANPRKKVSVS